MTKRRDSAIPLTGGRTPAMIRQLAQAYLRPGRAFKASVVRAPDRVAD